MDKSVREAGTGSDDAGLMRRVFPRETADTVARITGVPLRSVTRWLKGESRFPPTLREKFRAQAVARRAFLDDLAALIERHGQAGLLPEAMRQAILVELRDERFDAGQSL